MQRSASDVGAWIAGAPDDRRPALERLRSLCLEELGGYEETVEYAGL